MALTRSMLKGMGLTDEQVGAIIDEHTSVTDALKAQRDKYKEDADKLPDIEKELNDIKAGDSNWKEKYEKEHKAFEDYKSAQDAKEKSEKVKEAYKKLLTDNKIGEKHLNSILRVTDFSNMKLDKEGKLENESKLSESIKSEWADFVVDTGKKGSEVETPPGGSGGSGKTKDEIMNIKDTAERQQAIQDNHELFGF